MVLITYINTVYRRISLKTVLIVVNEVH